MGSPSGQSRSASRRRAAASDACISSSVGRETIAPGSHPAATVIPSCDESPRVDAKETTFSRSSIAASVPVAPAYPV